MTGAELHPSTAVGDQSPSFAPNQTLMRLFILYKRMVQSMTETQSEINLVTACTDKSQVSDPSPSYWDVSLEITLI